jgi:hypothetical protein
MADVHIHGTLAVPVTGGLAADAVTLAAGGGQMDAIALGAAAIIPAGRRAKIRRVTLTTGILAPLVAAAANMLLTIWTTTAAGVVQNRYFFGMGSRAVVSPWSATKTLDIDMPIDATAEAITINAAVGVVSVIAAGAFGPVTVTISVRVD